MTFYFKLNNCGEVAPPSAGLKAHGPKGALRALEVLRCILYISYKAKINYIFTLVLQRTFLDDYNNTIMARQNLHDHIDRGM